MESQSAHQTNEYLLHLLEDSISQIKNRSFQKALDTLKKTQNIQESLANRGGKSDPNIILITFQNTALCYQQLQQFQQSASYLDGCVYNSRNKNALANTDQKQNWTRKAVQKLKKARYICRLHLQLCAIFSVLNKHETALLKAKQAYKYASLFVSETYKSCLHKRKRDENSQLIQKRLPILEYLYRKTSEKTIFKGNPPKIPKLDFRSVLGVKHCNDWSYNYSIGDIMKIQPLDLHKVSFKNSLIQELSNELMFEKICLLISSLFCIGTQLKFFSAKSLFRQKQAKMWLFRAMDLSKSLLPIQSALSSHIKQVFHQNYKKKTDQIKKKTSFRTSSKTRANSAKRLTKQKPIPVRITPKARRPQSNQKQNRTRPDLSIIQKKLSIQPSISAPSIKKSQVQISSESSIDSDYFRQNFIITSDQLYGNNSDEENFDHQKIRSLKQVSIKFPTKEKLI